MKPEGRIWVLDPIRGLASLAVVFYHLIDSGRAAQLVVLAQKQGRLGVQAFFVISGFVIFHSLYAKRFDLGLYRSFVLKRVVRLDPPYFATIAIILVLGALSRWLIPSHATLEAPTFAQVVGHVAYVNGVLGQPWLIDPFWTLAIEFQFYLTAAVAYPLVARRGPGPVILLTAFGVSALLFPMHVAPIKKVWLLQHAPLFIMGIGAFWMLNEVSSKGTALAMIGFGFALTLYTFGAPEAVVGVATATTIVLAHDWRGPRTLAFLGAISYSLYLVHVPVGGRVVNLLHRVKWLPESAVVLCGVLASLAAATLLWRFVERPSQRISSSIQYRRGPEPHASST